MVEVLGKNYYIDIDGLTKKCQTGNQIKDEDGNESEEVNIFKYEILKVCLERVLNEYEEIDEELGPFGDKNLSISFKIAFNTLIKNQILIEDDE
jgi:hypothetical protein